MAAKLSSKRKRSFAKALQMGLMHHAEYCTPTLEIEPIKPTLDMMFTNGAHFRSYPMVHEGMTVERKWLRRCEL